MNHHGLTCRVRFVAHFAFVSGLRDSVRFGQMHFLHPIISECFVAIGTFVQDASVGVDTALVGFLFHICVEHAHAEITAKLSGLVASRVRKEGALCDEPSVANSAYIISIM